MWNHHLNRGEGSQRRNHPLMDSWKRVMLHVVSTSVTEALDQEAIDVQIRRRPQAVHALLGHVQRLARMESSSGRLHPLPVPAGDIMAPGDLLARQTAPYVSEPGSYVNL
jgi:hypothetical protein